MKTTHPLNTVVEMLGQEGAVRFLAFALPQIRQYRHDLLTCLQQHDWDQAATLAHRFKATAHLYSSKTLQDCLETIIAKQIHPLQQATFLPALDEEFQQIETSITLFVNNK